MLDSIELFSSDFIHNDDSTKKIFESIQDGKINIIVGTQLISKGFHFPKLNCIVIVNSDVNFLGNDIRSSEKTYQLMNQLSGRAGIAGISRRLKINGVISVALPSENPDPKM